MKPEGQQKLTANIIDCIDEIIGYGKHEHWDDSGTVKFNQDVMIKAIELITNLYHVFLEVNFVPDLIVPGPASDGQSIDIEIQHQGHRLFYSIDEHPSWRNELNFYQALDDFYADLAKDQTQLPADMAKVLYYNLWGLYEQ